MARGARGRRRDRARRRVADAFQAEYPGYRIIRPPESFRCYTADELRGVLEFLDVIRAMMPGDGSPVLMDMRRCRSVDPAACVLIVSEMHRCQAEFGVEFKLRSPKNRAARFLLAVFGVADDEVFGPDVLKGIEGRVMRVTSGARGDPSPGERTFKVAQLIEVAASEKLADRVHAALNEAADNVLSWAYGVTSTDPRERWWVAGMLNPRLDATFIALDRGVGIPATAPQTLGDSLQSAVRALQEGEWRKLTTPADWQVLLATIRQKRTQSGLGERGKGLTNMIELIDEFGSGRIHIFSGDAIYSYEREAEPSKPEERCGALGFRFPGTMVVWNVKAQDRKLDV